MRIMSLGASLGAMEREMLPAPAAGLGEAELQASGTIPLWLSPARQFWEPDGRSALVQAGQGAERWRLLCRQPAGAEGEAVACFLLSGLYLFILQTSSWGAQDRNKET